LLVTDNLPTDNQPVPYRCISSFDHLTLQCCSNYTKRSQSQVIATCKLRQSSNCHKSIDPPSLSFLLYDEWCWSILC